jgi:flagellar biosynthesis protein FlhF
MTDAIEQVRSALGDDAIIVASHGTGSGSVEVIAAVETARPSHRDTDFAQGIDETDDMEHRLERMLHDRLRTPTEPVTDTGAQGMPVIAFDKSVIAAALEAHAVPPALKSDLLTAAIALNNGDAVASLAAALEARIGFQPLPIRPQMPVMAIGLPGAGKTVTLAKLAARAVVDGAPVDIFTTDTVRTGAVAQGEAYAHLIGVHLRRAENVDALSLLLDERNPSHDVPADRSGRPCFIDTASVNPFDRDDFAALQQLTQGARLAAGVEPVLILSALGDADTSREAAVAFARLGARRIVATQLDIARRIGSVLAAADASGMAIAQISVTPYLARGLAQMNAYTCARMILDDGTHSAAGAAAKRHTGQPA